MNEEKKDEEVKQEASNDMEKNDKMATKEANIEKNKTMFIALGVVFVILLAISLYFFMSSRASQGELDLRNQPEAGISASGEIADEASALAEMGWGITEQTSYSSGEEFDILVYIDSKGKELGAFSFDLDFDENKLEIVADKGADGLSKGEDGSSFLVMANPNDIKNGFYKFSGICAQNCGRGDEMAVAVVHMRSLSDLDISESDYELSLTEISDVMGKNIN